MQANAPKKRKSKKEKKEKKEITKMKSLSEEDKVKVEQYTAFWIHWGATHGKKIDLASKLKKMEQFKEMEWDNLQELALAKAKKKFCDASRYSTKGQPFSTPKTADGFPAHEKATGSWTIKDGILNLYYNDHSWPGFEVGTRNCKEGKVTTLRQVALHPHRVPPPKICENSQKTLKICENSQILPLSPTNMLGTNSGND